MSTAWPVVLFTIQMALVATAINIPLALGAAVAAGRMPARWRSVFDAVISLPLVLPPTAVGFLLLELLSRYGFVGRLLEAAGIRVLFTPKAVVIATAVMSFPLMARAFRIALGSSQRRLTDMARTLGASPSSAFFRVALPIAWPGLLSGIVLAWCRAIGEFGATILIAGNIPGKTQTLALAIYQHVQTGREREAVPLIFLSIAISFGAIIASELLVRRGAEERS